MRLKSRKIIDFIRIRPPVLSVHKSAFKNLVTVSKENVMKKIRWVLLSILIVCCTAILAACGAALAAPTNVTIIDSTLSWIPVTNATNYIIEISGQPQPYLTSKTTYSLSFLEEGEYTVKIKANDATGAHRESKWSKPVSFTKEYESGMVYTLINGNTEYEITDIGKASGNIIIEDVYRGKPVTRIAARAFYSKALVKSVTIGNNVTSIGDFAFSGCSYLASVTIPESVTSIGVNAFQSCRALTNVKLPSKLTKLNDYVFRSCKQLQSIDLANVTSIGISALEECDALTSVKIPDTVRSVGERAFAYCDVLDNVQIGSNVTTLGDSAFFKCNSLTTVTGGEAVQSIGNSCFEGCTQMTNIVFTDELTSIGNKAFNGCTNLSEVIIGGNVASIGESAFDGTLISTVTDNNLIYVDNWIVGASKDIKTIVFKEGTVGIGGHAFDGCTELVRVENMPSTLRYIGDYAFRGCKKLTNLIIGDSVVSIGRYAFANCEVLGRGTVSFGTSLETIGSYAFYNCPDFGNTAYGKITLPDTVRSIGTWSFCKTYLWNNTPEGSAVYVGNWVVGFINNSDGAESSVILESGTRGISNYAFYKSTTLMGISIAGSVRYIGEWAFADCSALSLVSISVSYLTEIGANAFRNCGDLQSFNIPNGVQTIGNYAFYHSGIFTVTIPKNTTSIGNYAFYGCTNLLSVNFAENSALESIGNFAFANCAALLGTPVSGGEISALKIPVGVTSIGEKAFYRCSSLTGIELNANLTSLGNQAFSGCSSLKELVFPDTLTYIGDKLCYGAAALERITLGNAIKSIGNYAFSGCKLIKEIELPSTLESIGNYAFRGCTGLTSVYLSENILSIGSHAFNGCKYLTLYCEMSRQPADWDSRWNSGYRPVLWGCVLSADGNYVESFVASENCVSNPMAKNGITAPVREGYTFAGWKAVVNGTQVTVVLDAEAETVLPEGTVRISELAEGTAVIATWTEGSAEDIPEDLPSDSTGESTSSPSAV